jgi:uncharacterized membrane protein (DUF485 family)
MRSEGGGRREKYQKRNHQKSFQALKMQRKSFSSESRVAFISPPDFSA